MLSAKAKTVLNDYLNLPFKNMVGVRCPYFNNARTRRRAELKVLIGKGTPSEIVEEAKIISLQYHAGLFDHSGNCCLHSNHDVSKDAQEIRKFLVDNNLGVECSGFVTNILRAHFWETANIDIVKKFYKTHSPFFLRSIIAKLRPVENVSVRVWADDRNTEKLNDWQSAQAGDVIVILEKKLPAIRNHIILITENSGGIIKYAHARAWNSEGRYGHGVVEGVIKIIAPEKGIVEQEWAELGQTGGKNETWAEAKTARVVEIRRVQFKM